MISNLTALALDELTPEHIAELNPAALMSLQKEVEDAQAAWKKRADRLQEGLHKKFNDRATEVRHAKDEDTGTVNLTDDGHFIKCELQKRVEWDQSVLATLRSRIAAAGQNPDIYMQPEYKIAEASYKTWPKDEQEEFKKARTVKTNKPKYTITAAK